ncbi:hypothetical protein NQ315_008174 [Exocentrus adspersus]|uniref:Regucalcin n=1 Tax=Exocentrus adspersus TaxID=1586481 RepID=A0AAV8VWN5_9CUCU|nr:hypothetical protein NQ315_008174 [Exocentrus adspersus]
MAPKIEKVVDIPLELGESPHWDAETQAIYFVDINGHYINRFVPSTGQYTSAYVGANVSFIIPVEGKANQFVISRGKQITLISWDGERDTFSVIKTLYEVDDQYPGNVFNDGKCDPSGRLWAGTIGAPPVDLDAIENGRGTLYSFQNNKTTAHVTGLGISNGLAFNAALKKFYYIDSRKGTLDEYDFDVKNGTISNGKPIFTLSKHGLGGFLDGMTIDADGNLWAAVPTTHKLLKINPRKPETLLQTLQFPAQEVTAAVFGGPNLDELYVTTGRIPIPGLTFTKDDGATYRVTGLGVKGLPSVGVKL